MEKTCKNLHFFGSFLFSSWANTGSKTPRATRLSCASTIRKVMDTVRMVTSVSLLMVSKSFVLAALLVITARRQCHHHLDPCNLGV